MSPRQHPSHKDLLTNVEADGAPRAALDSIIVPNGRAAPYLRQAIAAAKENDAFLLVLCSMLGDASSSALEAKRAGVRVAAVNIDEVPAGLVPAFDTDRLLLDYRLHRKVDTSLKRNLGLLIARLAGWERILFLDDDIVLPEPADVAAAAGLLGEHAVVGLANSGMPDNSVVCHALRDIGAAQETFIGGGALVVGEAAFGSFFPNIYNEDWFFLLDGLRLRPSAVTGTAIQHPYDPYRDARRARGEELGDTLAEGVYGLLDNGGGLEDADEKYWREFLPDRRRIIQTTIERVQIAELDAAQKARMVACLKAAIGRSHLITPELCVQYLRAWQTDCARWRKHLGRYPRGIGIDVALAALGIDTVIRPGPSGRISAPMRRRSSGTPSAATV
jgi:glycosyltransferase involved in cell wall biosynthesis